MTKINKEGWENKTIKEVSSFVGDGDWIESKDQSEDGIRLIQTGNIGNGVFKDKGDKAKYISDETFDALDCTEIFAGDCLISRLPDPIGRACLLPNLDQRCITAVDCTILRFTEQILPKYFVYYSQSPLYASRIISFSTGSTRKRISRKNLEGIKIPLPPLPIQKRIVEELDEITAIISAKKQQISKLDELAQSIFYNMFGDPVTNEKGWEVKTIKEVAKVVSGSTPKTNIEEYWDGPYAWITPAEISDDDRIIHSTIRTITDEALAHTNLQLLPIGTVLLSSRAPIGKVAISGIEMYCNQGFKNLVCGDSLNNTYMAALLRLRKEYLQSLGRGATFKEISKSIVEGIRIQLPPLPLQETFAARVSAIEEEKAAIAASIEKMQTLLDARMQEYFG